ncbi:MAG: VOC family protein [Bacteroidales bacterium]|nr:VOC family protein [Bacteroidales bacterium]
MMEKIISGIQQIGIGVERIHEAWGWYKQYFGIDIRVFEEAAAAEFMLPYTGGEPRNRHAALAINLQGGGGFEIWQYTDRVPQAPKTEIGVGDLGIFAAKIKSKDVKATYEWYKAEGLEIVGDLHESHGRFHFFVRDAYKNLFQIVPSGTWFKNEKKLTGGSYGAVIGVTDMEKSKNFYKEILGYDEVIYEETGSFEDLKDIPGGKGQFRRVLLRHSKPRLGAFSVLFGSSQIELIQALDREPKKIFADRFWGDLGFIHLCFDIRGMDLLREECKVKGYPFTVDTGDSFDMGEAAGAFSYTEDPDGTLIEFVETHRVPILKKLGIYLNLMKRKPEKALPNWMLKSLSLSKARDIRFFNPVKQRPAADR